MNKIVISIATVSALLAGHVMADTQWQKDHPRREQVNSRLNNQDKRIHNEVKDGQITKAQAKSLHTQDHQIRQEERDMASHDNGHLTKADQHSLNQQENAVSHEIGK
ncbi:hypothetical protein HNQ50_001562 [Silvimonas terrae]|uniref:Uncharacterized protein n=1 Tax=Silvimonas terrae TaxID=300266 RepID=A0A840RBM0_9NEIS|nr:hypothetical protein [Silvimonas terrae]MBB5190839.1 hypothetical protein [Silvimonas terrae]